GTVGVPGVTNWKGALPGLEHIVADQATVYLAYDWPDVIRKQAVRDQLGQLIEALRELKPSWKLRVATWEDISLKGADDVYLAGKTAVPKLVQSAAELAELVAQERLHHGLPELAGPDRPDELQGLLGKTPTTGKLRLEDVATIRDLATAGSHVEWI